MEEVEGRRRSRRVEAKERKEKEVQARRLAPKAEYPEKWAGVPSTRRHPSPLDADGRGRQQSQLRFGLTDKRLVGRSIEM